MNFVIGGADVFFVCSSFNEDAEYFTLHAALAPTMRIVCSAPYQPGAGGKRPPRDWTPLANGTIEEIPWFS